MPVQGKYKGWMSVEPLSAIMSAGALVMTGARLRLYVWPLDDAGTLRLAARVYQWAGALRTFSALLDWSQSE